MFCFLRRFKTQFLFFFCIQMSLFNKQLGKSFLVFSNKFYICVEVFCNGGYHKAPNFIAAGPAEIQWGSNLMIYKLVSALK